MTAAVESLSENVRELRAQGRKRAVLGSWHVTIGDHYAMFEHEDDRARRLNGEPQAPPPKQPARRRSRARR